MKKKTNKRIKVCDLPKELLQEDPIDSGLESNRFKEIQSIEQSLKQIFYSHSFSNNGQVNQNDEEYNLFEVKNPNGEILNLLGFETEYAPIIAQGFVPVAQEQYANSPTIGLEFEDEKVEKYNLENFQYASPEDNQTYNEKYMIQREQNEFYQYSLNYPILDNFQQQYNYQQFY